jgi:prepilin-type N-terminal cleavage/methylation domain-containing protein
MLPSRKGFTLVELMIVVVIVGVLAAAAIPNLIAARDRAKEGSTKANMHTFQIAAEEIGVQNNGTYATAASIVANALPDAGANFRNPFSRGTGQGVAWEDRSSTSGAPAAISGITSYADSNTVAYSIKGYGRWSAFPLFLTSGQ